MKQTVVIITLIVSALVPAFGQTQNQARRQDKAARQLGLFESDWLTAILNRDDEWLERFFAGQSLIIPTTDDALAGRVRQTNEMIDPELKPEEMKIRISGNITLLTNGGNRSYYFLDTFNKRGGKWQIIATHFSRVSESKNENNIENNNENVEQTIMRLERERSDAVFKKDDAAMRRILADDFIAVESSGRILSKAQIISETERSGDARSGAPGDIKVKVYGETAIVTGRSLMKAENGEIDSDIKLLFTSIWAKRSGQWQAVNYQATRTK